MLKGKAKEEFNLHLKNQGSSFEIKLPIFDGGNNIMNYPPEVYFEKLPVSMKVGAVLEWFELEGITIETVKHLFISEENFEYLIKTKDSDLISGPKFYPSRNKALTKAIEYSNEYFNKNRI